MDNKEVDTRRKILPGHNARRLVQELLEARKPFRVIAGYFDPLTASHALRVEELARGGETLMVCLLSPSDELYPARARAELVASLAAVDYVFLPESGSSGRQLPGWLTAVPSSQVFNETAADLRRREELIQLIHSRNSIETT